MHREREEIAGGATVTHCSVSMQSNGNVFLHNLMHAYTTQCTKLHCHPHHHDHDLGVKWWHHHRHPHPETQKVKTFQSAEFHAQKLSGQRA